MCRDMSIESYIISNDGLNCIKIKNIEKITTKFIDEEIFLNINDINMLIIKMESVPEHVPLEDYNKIKSKFYDTCSESIRTIIPVIMNTDKYGYKLKFAISSSPNYSIGILDMHCIKIDEVVTMED